MPYFSHNGVELYYERQGSGQPLLLIAGLASDSQSWLPVLPELAERFDVITMDNRGVGRSSQSCDIGIGLMAEDCRALLRHLELPGAHLLGHSMGGMVALECALRYPEAVGRLVLAASAARNPARNNRLFQDWAAAYGDGTAPDAWVRTILAWIFSERFFEHQEQVNAVVDYQRAYPWPQSAAAFAAQVQAIASFDAGPALQRVTVPTLVLAGSDDILLAPHHSRALAEQIPGASLKILENAAHSLALEQPEHFVAEVARFLRG